MELSQICSYEAGTKIASYLLVQEARVRRTRDDKPYLDLVFSDASGRINGKIWDAAEIDAPEPGTPVGVLAQVDSYNEQLQLIVEKMFIVNEKEHREKGFNWELLIPRTKKDMDAMWQAVTDAVASVENPFLKKLLEKMIIENGEQIKKWPASLVLHHAYLGGYLEHIFGMMEVALPAARSYTLDADLVLAGVLLHDIGKLGELSGFPNNHYTNEGNFLGHIVIGWHLVHSAIGEIEDFPIELRLRLEHIILSHQGKYEYQSPKMPAFPEAVLVHYVDELDARLNMMDKVMAEDSSDSLWSNTRNYFKIPIYRGIADADD
ncbi:MAG TPA: HD domain-containing protein [Candidatus Marinimicrobia bacterium]|nr:HD domain-containing protein [Candidatus Neomarinimicrobiota bacterium]